MYNSIIQDGRSGDPDWLEAECVNCKAKERALKMDGLIAVMKDHVENTGHIMVQIGKVVIPIPKDQKIVRRIL